MDYDVLRCDVFDKLRDYEWFKRAIALEYRDIAERYYCVPAMSVDRLLQTFDVFWDEADTGLKNMPDGTLSLDQFKLSSYLCFWLRRINPIKEIRPLQNPDARQDWLENSDRLAPISEKFILYGNEIAAFTIALRISQYITYSLVEDIEDVAKLPTFRFSAIDNETTVEVAKILKHKNISSHSINIMLQMVGRIGLKTVSEYRRD